VVPPDCRLVRLAVEVLEELDIQPAGDASSTDANIPISRGVPAVCIGLTSGGNVHREDEFIDLAPIDRGVAQLMMLVLCAADELHRGSIRL
jgi:di/tripeptidase